MNRPEPYFPLTLGKSSQVLLRLEDDFHEGRRTYESWRESLMSSRSLSRYEEHPEARILLQLIAAPPTNRYSVILGEPGSGKTTLFKNWFVRIACEPRSLTWGMMVPVMVPLRAVPSHVWELTDDEELADAIWNLATSQKAMLPATQSEVYQPRRGRFFERLWLLDGLDEVAPEFRDECFYQKLANLPGRKIVSARTAIYSSAQKTAGRYARDQYEILSLKPPEQHKFLRQALDEPAEAARLFKSLQDNVQIRFLAGNPLMLTLMASLTRESNGSKTHQGPITLPASRGAFYEKAVENMWSEKLKNDTSTLRLRTERDQYLMDTARAMQLDFRNKVSSTNPQVENGLERAGLILVDDHRGELEFFHSTLQEYYLARSLSSGNLRVAFERYWSDPRYEETLGLLVSILFEDSRYQEIEDGLRWLLGLSEETHRNPKKRLPEFVSSPLRQACHVMARSAVSMQHERLRGVLALLLKHCVKRGSELRKLSLSADPFMPLTLLSKLADDENVSVRREVAGNVSTPVALLTELARDEDKWVRMKVAENMHTPAALLTALAKDQDFEVRREVAGNPSIPPQVLPELSRDPDSLVRYALASNTNASFDLLAQLAQQEDSAVRAEVARNVNIRAELLIELSKHDDVIWAVACNPNTPLEVLGDLARRGTNEKAMWGGGRLRNRVRQGLAENVNIPVELLAELAGDTDDFVRAAAASNVKTPVELLTKLANDDAAEVRRHVARNANTPIDLLTKLARDNYEYVRYDVAGNGNTSVDLLAQLARDAASAVREAVAKNLNAPATLLTELARDREQDVRWGLAGNVNTPPALLAELAREKESNDPRLSSIKGPPYTPDELDALLRASKRRQSREDLARNPSALLEDL